MRLSLLYLKKKERVRMNVDRGKYINSYSHPYLVQIRNQMSNNLYHSLCIRVMPSMNLSLILSGNFNVNFTSNESISLVNFIYAKFHLSVNNNPDITTRFETTVSARYRLKSIYFVFKSL